MPASIDRIEVLRLVREESAQLVEVLPRAEYEELHLPGAINIPLKRLDRSSSEHLDKNRAVITYCHDYQ